MSKSAIKEALLAFTLELAQHGRTDCYSRFNVRAGKGYQLAERDVSCSAIAAHLSGEQPIAIYLFGNDETHLAALDVDNHDGELDWEQVVAEVQPLVTDLTARGITPLVVRSGGGSGLHIWLVWRTPQKARGIRRFLKRLLQKTGLSSGAYGLAKGEVEIYPKQDRVSEGKFGNPIALPFARRSLPLDGEMQTVRLADYLPPDIASLYAPDIGYLPTHDLPNEPAKPARIATSPTNGDVQHGDEAEARSALTHVSAGDYDSWIRIGLILKWSFGESGFALWDCWSKSSEKYPGEEESREKWDSLEPDGSVGTGTLFHMAQQGGWNGPSEPEVRAMNAKYGVVTQGTRTMIIEKQLAEDEDSPFVWITKDVLKDRHKSHRIAIPRGENIEQIPVADYWLASRKADHYRRIDFNPDLPPGGNGNTYNIWTGFAVEPTPGDWSLLQDHIAHNICNNDEELNEWVLNWLALGVQQPGLPIGTVPVLSGLPGVGKGVLAHAYGSLFGRHYITVINQAHVSGRFNAHLFGRRFIFVDEGMWGGNRQDAGNIKTRVTEPYITVEAKGVDPIRARNRTIWMIASNEASIVPADLGDRRWQILEVGERNREDKAYFSALVNQRDSGGREAMLYDLLNRDITIGPDPRRTIKTDALFGQILRAQGAEFRYIYQILDEGSWLQPDAPGNGPGVTTIRALFEDMQASQPGAQNVHINDFGRRLNDMFPGMKSVLSGKYMKRQSGQLVSVRSTRHYFPPLVQCRRNLERYVGQTIPWSNDLEDWQSGQATVDNETANPF
ncbi:MAG: DUF5906 domain-containing protein [Cohaesibacteraceae bacterium]